MEKAEALGQDVKRAEADFKAVEATRRRRRRTSTPARRRSGPRPSGSGRSATGWRARCPRSPSPSTRASRSSAAPGSRRRGTACARPATFGCGCRSGSSQEERAALPVRVLQPPPLLRAAAPDRRRPSVSPALRLHVDGASRGNPGEAGFGVHVTAEDGSEVASLYGYLGKARTTWPSTRLFSTACASRSRGGPRASRSTRTRSCWSGRSRALPRQERRPPAAAPGGAGPPRPLRTIPGRPRPAREEPRGGRAGQPRRGRASLEPRAMKRRSPRS